jgi:hypothetical protein
MNGHGIYRPQNDLSCKAMSLHDKPFDNYKYSKFYYLDIRI